MEGGRPGRICNAETRQMRVAVAALLGEGRLAGCWQHGGASRGRLVRGVGALVPAFARR